MAMTTRQRLAQQREERPKPCRPTEEESRSETETDRAEGVPFREHKRKRCGKEIDLSWFDKARLRVIAAAVFGFRCLLTLEPGLTNKDLNFVHFLARTTAIIILLCLEHAWGLYPGHLNVNHYLNVDIMRMDLHHSFDAGIFFFLPTTAVLRKILEFTEFNTSKSRTRDKKKFYEVQRPWYAYGRLQT
ncbi:hypothetical protein GYMLUDRAFT_393778 [Collybiopsis luxurians FD-317 M1]|uniref:Uncharacterized protein n=1 Tax=Collybiopsis luxurians FD-317 M1 TaxID=944289 RepID=A0A0D0BPH6_9AGAR|nr:hypothetical protein GYMLUDRAFT_393778 [Collybiopsis luxurians FD-317 M1]